MKAITLCTSFLILGMTAQAQKQAAFTGKYPIAGKTDQVDDYFGTKVGSIPLAGRQPI
jgi:hypothetical protein